MHDVLRDLALVITSPRGNNDSKFLVRAGLRDRSHGNEEEWKQMKRISFMKTHWTLYPNHRILAKLPSEVGSLKNLEELQMAEVGVQSLPFEIRNLNRLISLIVSSTSVEIPVGVITSLISLEQLQIDGKLQELASVRMMDEVASLGNLTKIHFQFPTVEHLEGFLSSSWSWKEQRLLNFRFFVNDDFGHLLDRQPELSHGALTYNCYGSLIHRPLGLSHGTSRYGFQDSPTTPIPPAVMRVLSRSQEFFVKFHPVSSCDDIEILANGDESEEGDVLPDLEDLRLYRLPKLRIIMEGQVSTRSFSNLNSLILSTCHHVKQIFSWSMIKQLSKLENLSVHTCHRLEDNFEENASEPEMVRNDGHQLPRLKLLKLRALPKLVSIDRIISLASVSIEEIWIHRCNVKSLPSSLVDAPKLRMIAGSSRQWWDEKLEWKDNAIKQRLQILFSVR
ncbi:unnamed protein product [Dovyalis caffra]|uniref:Uncharacterized protein n=1 Tax=Dovyalis caffra TaxID=77055 RepID=A0AAV1S6A5_9ROSI|nr:unnamed protein product [Dovyalis caffra]